MTTNIPQDDLNEQIATLSPAKRALLELRFKKTKGANPGRQTIPRRANRDWAPLSFAQQRLWFINQLEPDSPAYNVPWVRRISGLLKVHSLEQSLNEIVRRHESLRTSFIIVDGEPVQVVSASESIAISIIDLSHLPHSEQQAQRLAAEEAQRPFDLSRGLLLRASLLRVSEKEHVLLLVMHHIVTDGWSMGVLFRELMALYDAFANGKPSPLAELDIQYADFAVWQRLWLQGEELERQLSYWRQQLDGASGLLDLPTDRPRPAVQSYRGAKLGAVLPKDLSDRVNGLSQREGATLFMTLLAAFQALLSRYSGQSDICVGSPIANRNQGKIEDLIGVFVNTLVLRTDLSEDPSFQELLRRVKEVALEAYAHQDLPFEKLVEELQPERSLSRNPLFDAMFVLQNAPASTVKLPGVVLSPWSISNKTTRFDLEVHVWDRADGLACTFIYNTDLFDEATIIRMMGHFQVLLEGVAADPQRRLSMIPLSKEAERHQLLEDWNATTTPYPQQCVHRLFEAQVEKTPDAVAVIFEKEQLSYRDLNRRANQLAHYLRGLGVGPEVPVGVCMERGVEMVVSLLGVLKAGGAYVPLDATYPPERLSFMLEDAGVRVLLTQGRLLESLQTHKAKVVHLETDWQEIARQVKENPVNETTAENLAYVMYTSGSTGTPKGVSIPHRGVARLVKETDYCRMTPGEVFLQFAPISFDASTFEIWGCLLNGARLVVFPAHLPSLDELRKTIQEHRITTLWLTAGLFHQIVEDEPDSFKHVKQLLAGGDVLSVAHVQKILEKHPECQLINGYGPTESTTFTCCYQVTADWQVGTTVPIGRPVANTQVYLLNRHMEPVAVSEMGELYIAGDGLARGYLNRPELTAEKFIPNPFSREVGARLYKTGDLARYLADGNIEFHGRIDNQVKVRGYRIEPGEIEAALTGHPAVGQCVVVARQEAAGDKRLVAYAVAAQGQTPTGGELRSLLKKKLPDYMIPAAFVMLESLPLTPNGKVDRASLPPPDSARQEPEAVFTPPRYDVERMLIQIWENLLNVRPIGIKENFFDLGGNSLLAVRMVSEIKKMYGRTIRLSSLFQGATVEQIASELRQDAESYSWPTLIEIQRGGLKRPFFCVSAPNVNALGYISLARHLGPDQPVYGLQSQYRDTGIDEYNQAVVEELAAEYITAMREVQPEGPYQLGGLCRGAHIAFEMARLLDAQGQKVSLLAILDTWVMENTYSYLWYLDHYVNRVRLLTRLNPAEQLNFALKKVRSVARGILDKFSASDGQPSGRRPGDELRDIYWPGRDFVPTVHSGRITVFRIHKQPYTRIRDATLGWGKRAAGGIDVHTIPGEHHTILREPYVQMLAQKLNDCIQRAQDESQLGLSIKCDAHGRAPSGHLNEEFR
jgi:aspartate racemase